MKKIYLLGFAAISAIGLSAQKNAVVTSTPVTSSHISDLASRSANDTMQTGADWTQQATIYGIGPAPDAGYVCGSNTYGDKQKVQIFYPADGIGTPTPYTVVGAMYWFGAKTVAGVSPGNLRMRTYKIDGNTGTSSAGTTTACPGTVVADDVVGIATIDTANIHIHNFSVPSRFDVLVSGQYPFGVGFDVTGLNVAGGDTIGLVSTTDGNTDPIFPESSWEQWSDNAWWSLPWAWSGNPLGTDPLDIELAIFPIAFNTASIDETPFLNGVKAFVPSPFVNSTIFTYELSSNMPSVTVNVIDMRGNIIYTKSINNSVDAGKYTLDFDGSSLNAGTYVMSVQAGQGRVATKFVKQ